jgi:dissimilatory sulfite reductase (desulfoviridin) alpha/beta subunit
VFRVQVSGCRVGCSKFRFKGLGLAHRALRVRIYLEVIVLGLWFRSMGSGNDASVSFVTIQGQGSTRFTA